MGISLNSEGMCNFVTDSELKMLTPQIYLAAKMLEDSNGPGSEFLGWHNLPRDYNKQELEEIIEASNTIREHADVFIVIGIGGSYLGSKAAIDLLKSSFYNNLCTNTPQIFFAGNNISTDYINNILKICENKSICINVISKSGTTTEPALAFRIFKRFMEQKYGEEETKKRIYVTTDAKRGVLLKLAKSNGYKTFEVPDDVGGRYSVLTPVGLLPMAAVGIDIKSVMEGAKQAFNDLQIKNIEKNDSLKYAAYRNCLYRKGKKVELLVSYEPAFDSMAQWFKQLFAESEGKNKKGIFPVSGIYSTDLHSIGQFVQDGSDFLFETVIYIEKPVNDLFINKEPDDFDSLNFLADQNMSLINNKAYEGTLIAHTNGNVPNIVFKMPQINEFEYGYMTYFFEKSCAVSGYCLGVNPFDQPGVEEYKNNMFKLLGKSLT